eukprot:5435715-Amphidinium_carterae.1
MPLGDSNTGELTSLLTSSSQQLALLFAIPGGVLIDVLISLLPLGRRSMVGRLLSFLDLSAKE